MSQALYHKANWSQNIMHGEELKQEREDCETENLHKEKGIYGYFSAAPHSFWI